MIYFIAKCYLCDQIKTDEMNGAHCTNRENVQIQNILVRKPEGIIRLLNAG
jgi:hypothetical protein